jgi:hypothetical protein
MGERDVYVLEHRSCSEEVLAGKRKWSRPDEKFSVFFGRILPEIETPSAYCHRRHFFSR